MGNPDGPAILFIHGWSQCDLCWSGQVSSQLAARFRMITFDNRSHGMSGKPTRPLAATQVSGYGPTTSPRSSTRPASNAPCSSHGPIEGVGHMLFLEDTERFNHELAAFADQARG